MAVPMRVPVPCYPEQEVAAALKKWWADETSFSSKLGNPFGDPRKTGGTVFDIQPEVSSLQAVEVLLDLENIVGFELPDSIIKLGGYNSCEEFVSHLVPAVKARFERHHQKNKE